MTCIYSTTINGDTFEVFGNYWETRNAWGHDAYLLRNGDEIGLSHVRYYNRTWESYQYQMAGIAAVNDAMKQAEAWAFEDYRNRTGKKRLSPEDKDRARGMSASCRAYAAICKGLREQRRAF